MHVALVAARLPESGATQGAGYEGAGYEGAGHVILRHPGTAVIEAPLRRLVTLMRVELE